MRCRAVKCVSALRRAISKLATSAANMLTAVNRPSWARSIRHQGVQMATINQSYNGFAAHAREATEKSVEAFTLATKPFTPSATAETDVPAVLAEPVQRYFHLFRRAVVANL